MARCWRDGKLFRRLTGISIPAVFASSKPNHGKAAVAWSMSSNPWSVGTPHAIGLVPRMGCLAPNGATNSGEVAKTRPISPALAIFSV